MDAIQYFEHDSAERCGPLAGIGMQYFFDQAKPVFCLSKDDKKIMLVVDLELWDNSKNYDRLGLDNETIEYFDTSVALVKIPVSPGRNLAALVEVAAINARSKFLGTNSAEEFADKVQYAISQKTK